MHVCGVTALHGYDVDEQTSCGMHVCVCIRGRVDKPWQACVRMCLWTIGQAVVCACVRASVDRQATACTCVCASMNEQTSHGVRVCVYLWTKGQAVVCTCVCISVDE